MKMNNSFDWFRLARTKGVGIKTLWEIYNFINNESIELSDLLELLTKNNEAIHRIPMELRKKLYCSLDREYEEINSAYEKLLRNRVKILCAEAPEFPDRLKLYGQQYGIPPILYARGHLPLVNAQSISIVGSRNIEKEGFSITSEFAKGLAEDGFNIVSGYAKGVDSIAHLSALEAEGTTTIVLSLGILNFEAKKDFKPLFSAFNTLVLSQFNPSEKWLARNAMARNKLVCALSDAVLVISSGIEVDSQGRMSGTFDAAKTALAMNIPVFVVSPQRFAQPPTGNYNLIELGCYEISSVREIRDILIKLKRDSIDTDGALPNKNIQLDLFSSV